MRTFRKWNWSASNRKAELEDKFWREGGREEKLTVSWRVVKSTSEQEGEAEGRRRNTSE
jgi:hypothetical protein